MRDLVVPVMVPVVVPVVVPVAAQLAPVPRCPTSECAAVVP
jgi:hypothetical protein